MRETKKNCEQQREYRNITELHKELPVFSQPWWLDVVAGPENWDIALSRGKNCVNGVLPYVIKNKFGQKSLVMPKLTQTLGPWVRMQKGTKHYRKLSVEKTVMSQLIDNLPKYALYRQNWAPEISNWQPFYWRGFHQTTRYTYVLPPAKDSEQAWTRIESKTRNQIRRAGDKHKVSCTMSCDTHALWNLVKETFLRQGMEIPYTGELFHSLQKVAFDNEQGINIIGSVDDVPVAGAFFVWDQRKMYYLASGSDRNSRDTHALSLILWDGIKLAVEKGLAFDFEGTMLENVEPHFRSFGAIQTRYFQVWKYSSRIIRAKAALKMLLKGKE